MAVYLTVLLIIGIIAGLFFLLRQQRRPSRARKATRNKPDLAANGGSLETLKQNSFFWGAEFWQPGCTESYKMLGQRFPFEQMPALPLPGCSRKACTCQFKGLRDRRVRARRIHPDRRAEVRFDREHPDRRSLASRRRGDLWAGHTL